MKFPLFATTMAAASLAALTALVACSDDADGSTFNESAAADARDHYAMIVLATYEDALDQALALDAAIADFVDSPSETGLEAAKKAWLAAREPYLLTEAFRFYEGPIDNEEGPEGLLNAWPLDENYIDYVQGKADSGIINDPDVTIDADTLVDSNEKGGEKNIATGYHAIEFLLWGQDTDDEGPGARPYTDYVDDGTAENQDRRRQYLAAVSKLLVSNLEDLVDAWKAGDDNYRKAFETVEPREAMRRILTGLTVLSGFETGGERLQAALDTGLQEDEHSCFSDNTHRDMIQDVQGIQNAFLGSYTRLNGDKLRGPSVYDVIALADTTLADQISDDIEDSLSLAQALQTPFDQEIKTGNKAGQARVAALVTALDKQADHLEDVFPLFDLTIPVVE